MGVWDLDEYAFGVNTTVAHYLRKLAPSTHQVCMPWITFGSSGAVAQPTCVTATNVHRRGTPDREGKCIMRTRRTVSLRRPPTTRR